MESQIAAIYERVQLRKISDVLIFSVAYPLLHRIDGHRRPILYSHPAT